MKWQVMALPLAVVAAASIPNALARMSSAVDREIPQPRKLSVPASPNVADMHLAVQQLADAGNILLGFEGVATAWQRPSSPERMMDVQIDSIGEGLEYLVQADTRYEWRPGTSVVHFRPKMTDLSNHFLHTRVPVFRAEHVTAEEVLMQIHRVFDSGYPFQPPVATRPLPASATRRVTFTLESPRIVDVLDTLVHSHPDLNVWSVTYRQAPAVYENSMIAIRSNDGWMASLPARLPE